MTTTGDVGGDGDGDGRMKTALAFMAMAVAAEAFMPSSRYVEIQSVLLHQVHELSQVNLTKCSVVVRTSCLYYRVRTCILLCEYGMPSQTQTAAAVLHEIAY